MAYDNSRDYIAFHKAGLASLYEEIGSYNLFMVCKKINEYAFRPLPDGYLFRLCRKDELEIWKRVVVLEQYVEYVSDYYNKVYAKNEDEFFRRVTFVCDEHNKPVASCFLWQSYGVINTLGWFRVLPEQEGKGLGRALLSKILKTARYPVYLHTQPTSVCALKLYSDFGFELITNKIIGYRKNDLIKSLPYLQKTMAKADYKKLKFTTASDDLHNAALLSKNAEL